MSKLEEELQKRYDEEYFREFHELIDVMKDGKDGKDFAIYTYPDSGSRSKSLTEKHLRIFSAAQDLGTTLNRVPEWIDEILVVLDKISQEKDFTRNEKKESA